MPDPSNRAVTTLHPGAAGFSGINDVTSARLNGFDVEPPDQGLCAFHGVVMEQVNLAVRVYTDRGSPLIRPVSLNEFFGQTPTFNSATNKYGPFLSDPRCYYDPQVGRWFSTALKISVNPSTGAFGRRSALLLAVSATSDPAGVYAIFELNTTDNGNAQTPRHANCPCFGDQPLLGADANAIVITTNEYSLKTFVQNNAQIYVASKRRLAALASGDTPDSARAVHLQAPLLQGFPSQTLQPATTPPGGSYAPNREYLLTSNDFTGLDGGHTIVLYTLTGTATLATSDPSLSLSFAVMPSEAYAGPVPARQRSGPHPLGASLDQPVPRLSANDDRMQQVIYTGGLLASALNTGAGNGGAANRDAIAWFVVHPQATASGTSGAIVRQGYVAVAEGSVLFPAIALNAAGTGAMVFTLTGEGYNPSAAYIPFTLGGPVGQVHINGVGVAPEDGFTCYPPFSGGVCRWGDYSAAVAEDGAIVMATEYIPGPRRPLANWGTYVTRYAP